MKYTHVIFDLDGTLVDSASEIHEAAVAICHAHSLKLPSSDYIRTMTGSPPRLFFLDHGCDEKMADQLVNEFRGHLASYAGNPACVFPEAVQLLSMLGKHDIRTSVATTKPTELAASLLERYGLARFFCFIQGTDPPLQHKPHPDILHACMERSASSKTVMVGDTIFDVQAAHNAGIDSVAVCSGAHSIERLASANPTYLVESLQQLNGILSLDA
jgi:phosphoglycolate phosphatase-like HAD superfamily hydrolase